MINPGIELIKTFISKIQVINLLIYISQFITRLQATGGKYPTPGNSRTKRQNFRFKISQENKGLRGLEISGQVEISRFKGSVQEYSRYPGGWIWFRYTLVIQVEGKGQVYYRYPGGRLGFRYTLDIQVEGQGSDILQTSRWKNRLKIYSRYPGGWFQVYSRYPGGRVGFRYTVDIQVEGFKNSLDIQVEGFRYTLDIHVDVNIYTQKKGYWGNFFKGLTLNKWELYPLQLTRYLTVCNSRCKDGPPPPLSHHSRVNYSPFIPLISNSPLLTLSSFSFLSPTKHFKTFSRCKFIN